jgi:hypothetical protein
MYRYCSIGIDSDIFVAQRIPSGRGNVLTAIAGAS